MRSLDRAAMFGSPGGALGVAFTNETWSGVYLAALHSVETIHHGVVQLLLCTMHPWLFFVSSFPLYPMLQSFTKNFTKVVPVLSSPLVSLSAASMSP